MKIKEEIIEIKSNTKLIKISEMEDELKYYTEETIKINNIIHKFTRSDFDSNEMTYIETNNLKESLLKQKKQIENDLEIIKKEIKEIQVFFIIFNKIYKNLNKGKN